MPDHNPDDARARFAAAEAARREYTPPAPPPVTGAGGATMNDLSAMDAASAREATKAGMHPINPGQARQNAELEADQARQRAERERFDATTTSGSRLPYPEVLPEQERHAEVIGRLDIINASLLRLDASLQQLISLLRQGK